MWICHHRAWSLSSCMSNWKIPSLPICLTLYSGNWPETIGNHPSEELNRSNTAITMTYIHTFPYDFTVRYIKGSTNQLADCLSRLGCQKDKIQLPKLKIHAITRQLPATADRLNQFHTETSQDGELVLLKHIVQTGWPLEIWDLPKEIQPYWTFCEEMTIEDGLLLKGAHIIVPQTLHKEMIQLLHTGHLRLEKMPKQN